MNSLPLKTIKSGRLYLLFIIFIPVFLFSGCVNGRIWGDNFFRGFLKGNSLESKVNDNKVYNTNITGISAKDTSRLIIISAIPLLLLFAVSQIRLRRDFKHAVSILVTLIENCESAEEIKRISSIFSQAYSPYRKLIDNELKKFKS